MSSKQSEKVSGFDNEALDIEETEIPEIKPDQNDYQITKENVFEGPNEKAVFEKLDHTPPWFLEKAENLVLEKYAEITESLPKFIRPKYILNIICIILYHIYLIYAIIHNQNQVSSYEYWCSGVGFLVLISVCVYIRLAYSYIVLPLLHRFSVQEKLLKKVSIPPKFKPWISLIAALTFVTVLTIFFIFDTSDSRKRLQSYFGIYCFIFLGFICSKHPSYVRWRHIIWGIGLQFMFGIFILRLSFGKKMFECLGEKFTIFLGFTDEGSNFVFGYLASQKPVNLAGLNETSVAFSVFEEIYNNRAFNFVFLFKILSVIYFFSFFVSMLFYLGALQWLVARIGWILQVTIGTTACESMNAAANIFLGGSEAPLAIRPYLSLMTPSELHAVMTGGFATIAGSVLSAYISFGISASHLLSASVMSAPAALASAKLLLPEIYKSKTKAKDIDIKAVGGTEANILDAAAQGATTAGFLVTNIAGMLVAVLAFIAFINALLTWAGLLVGIEGLTIEFIMGKCFIPCAWLMGVEDDDLEQVGSLLGIKTFINEFVAYERLKDISGSISERSKVITTYALCGFSNPISIGIQVSSLSTMAPERRGDVAKIAIRAFVAGSLACFLTASVAGSLIVI